MSQLGTQNPQENLHGSLRPGALSGPGQVKATCQDGALGGGGWRVGARAQLRDMMGPGIEATGHLPRHFFRDG